MNRARTRTLPIDTYSELHHIVPRSHNGTDDSSNLTRLTIREHRLAHLLLAAAGFEEQWYSVAAILADRLNKNKPHRFRHPDLIVTSFIRRKIAKKQAYDARARHRQLHGKKIELSINNNESHQH